MRNILSGSTEARRRLRARYTAMLVDEFQDTDPLQTEIALAFAADPDTGAIEHGRLFLVGDPKQSIYRFRRADMAVYSQTRDGLAAAGGSEEQLALNRRSHARRPRLRQRGLRAADRRRRHSPGSSLRTALSTPTGTSLWPGPASG